MSKAEKKEFIVMCPCEERYKDPRIEQLALDLLARKDVRPGCETYRVCVRQRTRFLIGQNHK